MKKLGLLMAMVTAVTVGGVYATWTYAKEQDVADETVNLGLNLTSPEFNGSYGTFHVDTTGLSMKIDPKPGTTHTTALLIEGSIVITFTPNAVATEEIKENGVAATFQFSLTNPNWVYDPDGDLGEASAAPIVTLAHSGAEAIDWGEPDENGVFTFTIPAAEIATHISLTEFVLDTKADYDAYNTVLGQGQIALTVSDGITSTPSTDPGELPEEDPGQGE